MHNVITIVDPPYVLPPNASGHHDGFMVELLEKLAEEINFQYNLTVVPGSYGHNEPLGSWGGLIGRLQTSRAGQAVQMAVGAIAKTRRRENAVKFSFPFQDSGIQLLLSRPEGEPELGAGLLLMPFTASAWTLIGIAFLLVSVGLFLIGRYSPHEWSQVPTEKDVRRARHSFGLRNSFLFAISTFTWQGYHEAPKSLSGRIVAAAWWCFTIGIVVAYTANLTALVMARPKMQPALPFRTYEDILRDRSIGVGIIFRSDVDFVLKESTENMAVQMHEYVRTRNNWVGDLEEGLNRIRTQRDKFALLLPSYKAEYLARHNCDLVSYGNSLDLISYAFAYPLGKADPIRQEVDSAIQKFKDKGILHDMEQDWLRKDETCTDPYGSSLPVRLPDRGKVFEAMGPRDLAVPFLFLFLSGIVAGVMITLEILYDKGKLNLLQRPDAEAGADLPLKTKPGSAGKGEQAEFAEEAEDLVKGDKFGDEGRDEQIEEREFEPDDKEELKKGRTEETPSDDVTIEREEEQEDNKPAD